jgi:hypothetical protein
LFIKLSNCCCFVVSVEAINKLFDDLNQECIESGKISISNTPSVNQTLFTQIENVRNVSAIESLVEHTSKMTQIIMKSNEKEDIGKVEMKSINLDELFKFLSKYDSTSGQSAVIQVPRNFHKPLERLLKIPATETLISHYKNSVGRAQLFIHDLKQYVINHRDFDLINTVKSHKMVSAKEFDVTDLITMIACCEQNVELLSGYIAENRILQLKMAILNSIGPKPFQDWLYGEIGDIIKSEMTSIKLMIDMVEAKVHEYNSNLFHFKKMNLPLKSPSSSIDVNASTVIADKKKTDDTAGKKGEDKKEKKEKKTPKT